jgi:hypothetical protein
LKNASAPAGKFNDSLQCETSGDGHLSAKCQTLGSVLISISNAMMAVPGADDIMLYEPKHPLAYSL